MRKVVITIMMIFFSIALNAATFMSSEMRIKPYNSKTEKYEVLETSKINVPIVVEDQQVTIHTDYRMTLKLLSYEEYRIKGCKDCVVFKAQDSDGYYCKVIVKEFNNGSITFGVMYDQGYIVEFNGCWKYASHIQS